MTTCNFQCTSLFHSKVVGVQSEQDNQGYKEMKGHMQWLQLISEGNTLVLNNSKITAYIAFYASKLQDYVGGLLFQNIPKPKNHTCWFRSPIFSHSIKLLCDFLLVLWCRVTYLWHSFLLNHSRGKQILHNMFQTFNTQEYIGQKWSQFC